MSLSDTSETTYEIMRLDTGEVIHITGPRTDTPEGIVTSISKDYPGWVDAVIRELP